MALEAVFIEGEIAAIPDQEKKKSTQVNKFKSFPTGPQARVRGIEEEQKEKTFLINKVVATLPHRERGMEQKRGRREKRGYPC